MAWKDKVAEHGNTQVKYLKIVIKYSSLVENRIYVESIKSFVFSCAVRRDLNSSFILQPWCKLTNKLIFNLKIEVSYFKFDSQP